MLTISAPKRTSKREGVSAVRRRVKVKNRISNKCVSLHKWDTWIRCKFRIRIRFFAVALACFRLCGVGRLNVWECVNRASLRERCVPYGEENGNNGNDGYRYRCLACAHFEEKKSLAVVVAFAIEVCIFTFQWKFSHTHTQAQIETFSSEMSRWNLIESYGRLSAGFCFVQMYAWRRFSASWMRFL